MSIKRSAVAQARINTEKYNLACDRKTIYDLSLSKRYKSDKSSLIKHANRNTCRINYKTLNLTQRRSYRFVNKWYKIKPPNEIAAKGLSFFETTDDGCKRGRKRAFSIDEMWQLFIHYFATTAEVDVSITRYAKCVCVGLKISSKTAVRYLKLFTIAYKRKVQPHKLTEKNKQRRLSHCEYWINKLGKNYYFHAGATCDETTIYTNDILIQPFGRMPLNNLNNYENFEQFARQFHFLENKKNQRNEISLQENPTINIASWTMPPCPVRLVCEFIFLCVFTFI